MWPVTCREFDGTLARTLRQRAKARLRRSLHQLPPEEAAVLALLEHRLAAETKGA
jgi:DNA topoisomerase-1